MKRINYLFVMFAALSFATACKNVNYKKAKSGLLYKIFPSDSKDSIAKPGNWVKLHFTMKLNDSILQTTYGKMPIYAQATDRPDVAYNPTELLTLVKTGDSAVSVALADSLFKRNMLPENQIYKKGDRLTTTFKVLGVFKSDSTYMLVEHLFCGIWSRFNRSQNAINVRGSFTYRIFNYYRRLLHNFANYYRQSRIDCGRTLNNTWGAKLVGYKA